MPPLVINVTGKSTVQRLAERAVLNISIESTSAEGQSKVGSDVRTTCATLQNIFTQLSPKTESGHAAPEAAITVWTMSSISSSSKIPYQRDDTTPEKPREYTASSSFEVTFQKFEEMGNLLAQLSEIPFVAINRTHWQLTEPTKRALEVESRKAAMSNAVGKANDLAEVIGRYVTCVEVKDKAFSVRSSRGAPSQELDPSPSQLARQRRFAAQPDKLIVHPETLEFDSEVEAKFATQDVSIVLKLGQEPY
jgi:uncharacterized protein YggE